MRMNMMKYWVMIALLLVFPVMAAAFAPTRTPLVAKCRTTKITTTTRRHGQEQQPSALHYRQEDMMNLTDGSSATRNDIDIEFDTIRPKYSSIFKPWHFADPANGRVKAHGDYAQDLYLEEHIGGPLYSRQRRSALLADQEETPILPKLPIPPLNATAERLLPTVLTLAQQEPQTNETEIQTFLQAWQDFCSEAEPLHQRLLEHANRQVDTSWVQAWWQSQAYLQYRQPLSHYVSYYLMVPDDEKLLSLLEGGGEDETSNSDKGEEEESPGLLRAAAILHNVAESRKLICSGTLPPDTMAGNAPLCSVGFKYMFHASRVPALPQDFYHLYDPALYKHSVVAVKGQFFEIDILDENEDPLPLPALQAQLRQCQKLAKQHESWPQLGWCTSLPRDEWAEMRQELIDHSPVMAQALERLESAAFLLNLDDEAPTTFSEKARQFWHGGEKAGANRWFDKSMQILVTRDGAVAYQGEHSMVDAAPVITVIQRIVKNTYHRLAKRYDSGEEDDTSISSARGRVSNVFAECWKDPALLKRATEISERARQHHVELSSQFDVGTLRFEGLGKKKAKQWGYDGPLLAQLAIQLASYRLFGKLVPTYEAASTRAFLHGRTEAVRPVLPETLSFVRTFSDDKATVDEKLMAVQAAASVIGEYQTNASRGHGVDRHLFGLMNMLKQGEEAPKLFSHPLFQRSKKFRLSTSSVVFLPGFGPVEEDGLGIGFNAEKESFVYTVTSKKENNYVEPFCKLLDQALQDIADLLDRSRQ